MDPATAKTLVSAALVTCIAVFSLVSAQALVAQVMADLRAVRRVPVRADRPRRGHGAE